VPVLSAASRCCIDFQQDCLLKTLTALRADPRLGCLPPSTPVTLLSPCRSRLPPLLAAHAC